MIKAVDEIPMSARVKSESARSRLNKELSQAVNCGITKFEVDGDYNKKYLNSYVREELRRIFALKESEFVRKWKKENNVSEYFTVSNYSDNSAFFKVHKYEDRVFVELFIDNYDDVMERKCRLKLEQIREYHERKANNVKH